MAFSFLKYSDTRFERFETEPSHLVERGGGGTHLLSLLSPPPPLTPFNKTFRSMHVRGTCKVCAAKKMLSHEGKQFVIGLFFDTVTGMPYVKS